MKNIKAIGSDLQLRFRAWLKVKLAFLAYHARVSDPSEGMPPVEKRGLTVNPAPAAETDQPVVQQDTDLGG